jgi:hypothetical protein
MQKDRFFRTAELNKYYGSSNIGSASPFPIDSYQELLKHVAHLSFLNKNNLLFFRGQTQDNRNRFGESTFYPSIYRGENLTREDLEIRFLLLDSASRQLIKLFQINRILGNKEVRSKQYIRWSILQHYEVCSTPLLDFTHSLRVACSFAQLDEQRESGYLYIFGLPITSNRISINSEHDIVNIRLLSICPPDALRPYYQEGYLAGTSEVTLDYDKKSMLDFKNRLVAKFTIPNNEKFWGNGINKIPTPMLFPEEDRIKSICKSIKPRIEGPFYSTVVGDFITEWVQLEHEILARTKDSQKLQGKPMTLRQAIRFLYEEEVILSQEMRQIEQLYDFRNLLVHKIDLATPETVLVELKKLRDFKHGLGL